MSNLVLNTLTYVGDGIANGISRFTERSLGIAKYFKAVTGSVGQATSGRISVKFKLVYPYPDAVPESCPCDGELPFTDTIVNLDFRFDGRTDTAYRTAVYLAVKDLVATTQFQSGVKDLVLVP